PLPTLICIATVSLCAKPEIDGFADDRRVGRLATCGDAAYRGGLLPRQLNLFPLHAIMMAQLRDRDKYLSGSSARASRAPTPMTAAGISNASFLMASPYPTTEWNWCA